MNDTLEKTASSLAVVEKKPQRPGGCVGIFFQLFDWNRRFAKKKLFSKKLLPPVWLKQASKKFGGDEKQPKLRLIADENSGGFPNSKNNNGANKVDVEQKNEIRTPGLVARLMGLESMPALQRDKSKKVPASGFVSRKPEKFVDDVCGYVREQLNVEKGGIKQESRPQKLQKTSVCERQLITRFGAEKPPFNNLLSKSRKHYPKLPSPVKSPRNLSRKKSSRLIGAATKILEPGLQQSRLKCALNHSNNLHHPPENVVLDERTHSLSSQLDVSEGFAGVAVKGQSSCRNCGYVLDNLGLEHSISEQPLVFASPFSHSVGSSCQGPEKIKPGESAFCRQLEEEFHEDYRAVTGPAIGNLQSLVKLTSYRSPFDGQTQGHWGSQQCKPLKGVPVSLSSNQKTQSQNQMLQMDTVPPRSKLNGVTSSKVSATNVKNGTQDFVSANQSLSGSTRSQMPAGIDNGKFEQERRIANRLNKSVPPGRKRRPSNIFRHGESSGSMSSASKQNFGSPHVKSEKRLRYNVHFINCHCDRNGLLHRQERTVDSGQVDNNVVSFTFNPSVKQNTGIHEVAERRVQNNLQHGGCLQKSALGENGRSTKLGKPVPLSGDALGALLEQKLKELNSQGEDIGGIAPKKTTAKILQELISALASEIPFQQDNLPAMSDRRISWGNHSHLSNTTSSTSSQANAMGMKLSVDQALDCEHLSPGGVLEAYFSTESCPSSLDDSLGYKMPTESMDCSYNALQLPNPETELLDSAASINLAKSSSKELIINILNNVSEILCCSSLADCGLKGNKLDQTKETLLNAELVFHNAGSFVGKNSPVKHLLLDELEMLASILWMNFGCSVGIEEGIEVNQLRRFAFNSIIEYLDSRFGKYPTKVGSKVSRRLPLLVNVNANTLIFEIVEVVRKWEELCKLSLDELIEREMGHSLGEWTECENEGFETGMEISRDIFQILVDEIVIDLLF